MREVPVPTNISILFVEQEVRTPQPTSFVFFIIFSSLLFEDCRRRNTGPAVCPER
jgi:hypothetical protein